MSKPLIRCAIYTRKSSDEGLDQDFNSLDAQHEACAAYIASQKHEGWKMRPERYDDGGVSGGTLDRPALNRLLTEIDAGRIDMVVVYKIDRLTRSLADFAKLVERLEAAGCSFVSVTQAFNTSSSMGRLTLNVLLSFAQFEREVTAERIRDKIAASKKKGLWMGGVPPLGYDPHPDKMRRELVVNEDEAEIVRELFDLYHEHGCLSAVTREAEARGLRSKRHIFSTGRVQGGNIMSQGQIHKVLTNPIYRGLIRHKEVTYPGLHDSIIDEALWEEVQHLLQSASRRRRGAQPGGAPDADAPLKGLFCDETGDHLTPTHCQKNGRRFRYYVSNRLVSGGCDPTGWRLPARELEVSVANHISHHLGQCAKRHLVLEASDAASAQGASRLLSSLASAIAKEGIQSAVSLIRSGRIGREVLTIDLDPTTIASAIGVPADQLDRRLLAIEVSFECRRRGVEIRIVAGDIMPAPDPSLIRALRNARIWSEQMRSGIPLAHIAKSEKASERYMSRIMHLDGLSPKIKDAIVNGRQPIDLTLKALLRTHPPLAWDAQERQLGFAG